MFPRRSLLSRALGPLAHDYVALAGVIVLIVVLFTAIFGPLLTPLDPLKQSLKDSLLPPGSVSTIGLHLLGTDELGRDTFTRLVYGTGSVLQVSAASVALAAIAGSVIGLISGFARGWVDRVLMRLVDIQLSVPPIIIAILLAVALTPGTASTIIAIALMAWPQFARVVRAETMKVSSSEFISLSRIAGVGPVKILLHHVAPNVASTIIVLLTLNLSIAIIFSGGLSFLGVGIQPPTPDWGNMLAGGTQFLQSWWMVVFPGLAITLTVLAFNLVGDFLRDATDPRLKGRSDSPASEPSIIISGTGKDIPA